MHKTPWHELCKNVWTDQYAIWVMDSGGPKEACIRWGRDPHAKRQLLGEGHSRHARRHSAVSCTKMAEPIDFPFGLWTVVGWRKHVFNRIRRCALVGGHIDATWRIRLNRCLRRRSAVCSGDWRYVKLLCHLLWFAADLSSIDRTSITAIQWKNWFLRW